MGEIVNRFFCFIIIIQVLFSFPRTHTLTAMISQEIHLLRRAASCAESSTSAMEPNANRRYVKIIKFIIIIISSFSFQIAFYSSINGIRKHRNNNGDIRCRKRDIYRFVSHSLIPRSFPSMSPCMGRLNVMTLVIFVLFCLNINAPNAYFFTGGLPLLVTS